jgi:ketosteroid isomerase-like protein
MAEPGSHERKRWGAHRSENVELIRRLIDAFSDVDVDAALEVTHPAVEFESLVGQITGHFPSGHEGIRQWFANVDEAWEEIEAHEMEIEERGEWVLVTGLSRGRDRQTGAEAHWDWTAVGRATRGRITRFGIYFTRDEALGAMEQG